MKNIKQLIIINIIFSCLFTLSIYSQTNDDDRIIVPKVHNPLKKYQAPNISTFNTYGSIPVSLYTGNPQISIPIYTIDIHKISIPVSLGYNINNVKPNTHPGVVGLGWNLLVGGNITRIQRGNSPDEYILNGFHFPQSRYNLSFVDILNQNNWTDVYGYADKFKNRDANFTYPPYNNPSSYSSLYSFMNPNDVSPDQFNFNFLGYSGAFYLDENKKWIVDSETPFEIEYTILPSSSARASILKGLEGFGQVMDHQCNNSINERIYDSFFEKFTLKAPNGIVFEFGGINAIDYSANFQNRASFRQIMPTATTWHLSKIKLANGEEILFHYNDAPPTLEGNMDFWVESDAIMKNKLRISFQFVLSVQLSKITYLDKPILTFSYSNSKQLDYDYEKKRFGISNAYENELSIADAFYLGQWDNVACDRYSQLLRNYLYVKKIDDIQWSQLDRITLPNGAFYEFEYTNSKDERLKLISLALKKSQEEIAEKHSFKYNPQKLPSYFSGFYDHMGFYNGKDFSFVFNKNFYSSSLSEMLQNANKFYNSRTVDTTGRYLSAEMLEFITYPTGGYSSFSYEHNDMHAIITPERTSWYQTDEFEPFAGLRIKKRTNYAADGTFLNAKRYYYMKDFNPTSKNGDRSSGVGAFYPQYHWRNLNITIDKSYRHIMDIFLANPTNQAYHNLDGEYYVGYSEVIECDEDKNGNIEGYTKYKFTSFDDDIFDNKALVDLNANNTSYHKSTPYSPYSSNRKKRGKLKSKEIYDINNKIMSGIYNNYMTTAYKERKDIVLYTLNVEKINNTLFYEKGKGLYMLGGAYIHQIYEYLLNSTMEKTFFGSQVMEKKTTYNYNSRNQVTYNQQVTGDGNSLATEITYAGDLDNLQDMKNLRYHDLPIEVIKYKDNKVVSVDAIFYKNMNKDQLSFLPYKYYKLETDMPLEDYKQTNGGRDSEKENLILDPRCRPYVFYHKYDKYENPIYIEVDNLKSVYLWSYNGRFPIAEIENTTYDDVKKALGGLPESISLLDIPEMSKIEALREKLTNAQITTYTYSPFIGRLTKTDPRGVTTYYDYDSFGRLKEVYIKETSMSPKRVIESYNYHLVNP